MSVDSSPVVTAIDAGQSFPPPRRKRTTSGDRVAGPGSRGQVASGNWGGAWAPGNHHKRMLSDIRTKTVHKSPQTVFLGGWRTRRGRQDRHTDSDCCGKINCNSDIVTENRSGSSLRRLLPFLARHCHECVQTCRGYLTLAGRHESEGPHPAATGTELPALAESTVSSHGTVEKGLENRG